MLPVATGYDRQQVTMSRYWTPEKWLSVPYTIRHQAGDQTEAENNQQLQLMVLINMNSDTVSTKDIP